MGPLSLLFSRAGPTGKGCAETHSHSHTNRADPKDKEAEDTGRTVQDGDESLDLPKVKLRVEVLQTSLAGIRGIPDMDDLREHFNHMILEYEAFVKELTPKPLSRIQARTLLKQWDKTPRDLAP